MTVVVVLGIDIAVDKSRLTSGIDDEDMAVLSLMLLLITALNVEDTLDVVLDSLVAGVVVGSIIVKAVAENIPV